MKYKILLVFCFLFTLGTVQGQKKKKPQKKKEELHLPFSSKELEDEYRRKHPEYMSWQEKEDLQKIKNEQRQSNKKNKIDGIYVGKLPLNIKDNSTGKIKPVKIYVLFKQNLILTGTGESAEIFLESSNWLSKGNYQVVGNKILVNFTSPKYSTETYTISDNGQIKISEDLILSLDVSL